MAVEIKIKGHEDDTEMREKDLTLAKYGKDGVVLTIGEYDSVVVDAEELKKALTNFTP